MMKRVKIHYISILGLVLALVVILSTEAQADLTTVYPPPSGEASIINLLDNIYGGTFSGTPQNAPFYTNGTITATRVDDALSDGSLGLNLNVVTGVPGGEVTDQWWDDGFTQMYAEAKFAGYGQEFGYDDVGGGGPVTLFPVEIVEGGDNYDVTGSGFVNLTGETWEWLRGGTGSTWSSVMAKNDGVDHMITYQITGLNDGWTTWLLCWEDLPNGDWDYNDMVIEIRAVPLPGAVLLGLLGLGVAGLKLRKFA